jgi:hypothetical protein
MSKTHNKYSKNFINGFDDTHHIAKKQKELSKKKIEKQVDNTLKAKDLNKILVLEEHI